MLVGALLLDYFFDPAAFVGQHMERVNNRPCYAQDQKQLEHEQAAFSFEGFYDVEGRNLLGDLVVSHHDGVVAGLGPEIYDVSDNEYQPHQNDQHKSTGHDNTHSGLNSLLRRLE